MKIIQEIKMEDNTEVTQEVTQGVTQEVTSTDRVETGTGLDNEGTPAVAYTEDWQMGKFATAQDLGDSYQELQSKFGGFTGAPADGEYVFEFDENLGEITIDTEDPMYQNFISMASASGMSNDTANEMMSMYVEQQHQLNEASQASAVDYDAEVDSIDNFEDRTDKLGDWAHSNLSSDEFETFKDLVGTKAEFEMMERLMGMANSTPSVMSKTEVPTSATRADPAQKYRDMMRDPRFEIDPAFQKQVFDGLSRSYRQG